MGKKDVFYAMIITFLSSCSHYKLEQLHSCYSSKYEEGSTQLYLNKELKHFYFQTDHPMVKVKYAGKFEVRRNKLLFSAFEGQTKLIAASSDTSQTVDCVVLDGFDKDTLFYALASSSFFRDKMLAEGKIRIRTHQAITFKMVGHGDAKVNIPTPGLWHVYLYPDFTGISLKKYRIGRDIIWDGKFPMLPCEGKQVPHYFQP
jgi:hypothetical protein